MKTGKTRLRLWAVACVCLLTACGGETAAPEPHNDQVPAEKRETLPHFQSLLDSARLEGGVFVFDPQQNIIFANDFSRWDQGQLPASTFKIPNSLIALETGVVQDQNTVFKWDGKKRRLKQWEQDLNFHDAFHLSCVPCYQEIARKVGVERMKNFLAQFEYGNMIVDSASIDKFWLEGESKISPQQQIAFLQRLHDRRLGISARSDSLMKQMMVIADTNGFRLSGKTGWAIRDSSNTGWFVGFVEHNGKTLYFATLVFPLPDFDIDNFASARREITLAALRYLKAWW